MLYVFVFLDPIIDDLDELCDIENFVSREEWGAKDPTMPLTPQTNFNYLIVHSTTYLGQGSVQSNGECPSFEVCKNFIRQAQEVHMERGFYDIGYNYLIDMDGNIYEGRGLKVEGAHTYRYNCDSYGVAFIGRFDDNSPSNEAISAFSKLRQVRKYLFMDVLVHYLAISLYSLLKNLVYAKEWSGFILQTCWL